MVDAIGRPRVVYHGTNQHFDTFSIERRGAATGVESAAEGFFFTDSPEVASDYAQYAGRRVVSNADEHARRTEDLTKRMAQAERRGRWDEVERLTEELEAHELGAMRQGEAGSVVYPVFLSLRDPLEADFAGGCPPTDEVTALLQRARAEGRDGAILRRINDSPGRVGESTQYVVFRPDQVRFALGCPAISSEKALTPHQDME